jgi:PHP family Zn ribbon phosphoesterase
MRITPDKIEHEERIVWEQDPSRFEYVRQRLERCGTRVKGVPFNGRGERVGYAVLAPHAPRIRKGVWERRVFYVRSNDRSEHPREAGPYEETAPYEAVDPRSLAPGAVGRITQRVWKAPSTS